MNRFSISLYTNDKEEELGVEKGKNFSIVGWTWNRSFRWKQKPKFHVDICCDQGKSIIFASMISLHSTAYS